MQPVYREILRRGYEVHLIINKLGQGAISKPSASVLAKLETKWERVKNEAVERHAKLHVCMKHGKEFSAAADSFMQWLDSAELKLESLPPTNKAELDQQHKDKLKALRKQMHQQREEYVSLGILADIFVCDDKQDVIDILDILIY